MHAGREAIKSEARHLMCYHVKESREPKLVTASGLFVNNQFGPDRIDAVKVGELCVPSQKTLTP